ncbi:hypothetical protein A2K61_005248, partial [Escherichia coli]|nr:hypothetical protein [Escherichia coli]
MNTEKQLPSGIESEVKYTLQFWLLSNGKVMTEKDGRCNPFPPNCIESAHPFTPFQQNQWIELDTVGSDGPVKATFLVHSVLHKLKRQGGSLNDAGRPEYGRCIAHWHTDVF